MCVYRGGKGSHLAWPAKGSLSSHLKSPGANWETLQNDLGSCTITYFDITINDHSALLAIIKSGGTVTCPLALSISGFHCTEGGFSYKLCQWDNCT